VVDKLRRASSEQRFDALIAFKAIHLPQQEILALPVPIKVHYSPDDVSNPAKTTDDYLRYEPGWDMIVTTKQHNVPEIADRGGRPLFVWSAYDDAWHRPWPQRFARQFQVGLIGAWRADRNELLRDLVDVYRRSFRLGGPGWSGRVWSKATLTGPVYGEDFLIAIADTSCNLVLLNSDNRDQQTCRSFEVPASDGLFVGERTPEHEELLEDGKECLLFCADFDSDLTLTTHGGRLSRVFIAIEGIARGAVLPRRIILYLYQNDGRPLPRSIVRLERRGLEVRRVADSGRHTKYFPYVCADWDGEICLVTADDAVIYPRAWLQELYATSQAHRLPTVVCHRAYRITFEGSQIAPYNSWGEVRTIEPSFLNFATGASGIHYPVGVLRIINDLGFGFQGRCDRADDIWLHKCAVTAKTRIVQCSSMPRQFPTTPGTQRESLLASNVGRDANDAQIQATCSETDLAFLRGLATSEESAGARHL
jgi:hypothetical protein